MATDPIATNYEEDTEDLDQLTEVLPYSYSITAYGTDFPVDGLVKRIDSKDIYVPQFNAPSADQSNIVGFQREYVWRRLQSDRFIESLLLGLPVPGIFLVREASGIMLVLDGHQRLRTLAGFYAGVLGGSEFKLEAVQPRFRGLTYKTLEPEDRRRLDNSIIHATIVRQDQPTDDQSSIYLIFERLNSGGTILQPMEIRIALYHGPFVAILNELNQYGDWRDLYGNKSPRLKDIELILRSLALLFYRGSYERPMKGFLNRYMAANRNLGRQGADELKSIFSGAVKAIRTGIGVRAFRPKNQVNAAVLDSLIVGVSERLKKGPITDSPRLKAAYEALLMNPKYSEAIGRATADEENVTLRCNLAVEAFQQVP